MFKALIFDIVSSKKMEDRENFQYFLIEIIRKCNKVYKEYIISSFQITSGDEWEGLVTFAAPVKEIINFFREEIPVTINFYVGIGVGELSVRNLNLPVNQLDGSVFHSARENLNFAKANGIIYTIID